MSCNDWPQVIRSVKKLLAASAEPDEVCKLVDDVNELLEVDKDGDDSDCGDDVEHPEQPMTASRMQTDIQEEEALELVRDVDAQVVTTASIIAMQEGGTKVIGDASTSVSTTAATGAPSTASSSSAPTPAPSSAVVPVLSQDSMVGGVSLQSLAALRFESLSIVVISNGNRWGYHIVRHTASFRQASFTHLRVTIARRETL